MSCRAVFFSLGATPSSMSNMMASALSPRALSIIFSLWPGTNIHDRFKSIVLFPSLVSLPEAQENVYHRDLHQPARLRWQTFSRIKE
jgi:hypothetical protein